MTPELQGGYARLFVQVSDMHVSELSAVYESREIPANRQRTYPRMFGDGVRGGA